MVPRQLVVKRADAALYLRLSKSRPINRRQPSIIIHFLLLHPLLFFHAEHFRNVLHCHFYLLLACGQDVDQLVDFCFFFEGEDQAELSLCQHDVVPKELALENEGEPAACCAAQNVESVHSCDNFSLVFVVVLRPVVYECVGDAHWVLGTEVLAWH